MNIINFVCFFPGVVFEDGTREDIDLVVLSTGYTISYPFIVSKINC